jgi:hypothetical protein
MAYAAPDWINTKKNLMMKKLAGIKIDSANY